MDKKFEAQVRKALKMKEMELKSNLATVQTTLAQWQPSQPTQRRRRRRQRVDLPELDAGLRSRGL